MTKSENINELAKALCEAQKIINGAIKSKENPFFKSTYADLESVWDEVRKPLTENGLSVYQSIHDGKIVTMLLHSSGQWIEHSTELKCKNPSDPQAITAAFTYYRRSMLAGVSGCPQSDDDGNTASNNQGYNLNNKGVTNETKRDNQTTNGRHSSTSFTPNQSNYSSSGWSTKNMESNKETAPTQSGNAKGVLVNTRANQQNTENVTYQALSEYVVKVGKHKGLSFAELEDTQIQQTKEYYKAEVLSKEKPPRPEVKELYEKAIMYLDVKKLKETMKGTLS